MRMRQVVKYITRIFLASRLWHQIFLNTTMMYFLAFVVLLARLEICRTTKMAVDVLPAVASTVLFRLEEEM